MKTLTKMFLLSCWSLFLVSTVFASDAEAKMDAIKDKAKQELIEQHRPGLDAEAQKKKADFTKRVLDSKMKEAAETNSSVETRSAKADKPAFKLPKMEVKDTKQDPNKFKNDYLASSLKKSSQFFSKSYLD